MTSIAHIASNVFSPTGALATLTGYEHRPQQETMARAIAEALQNQRHLIVEAPTGIGKTLAYLVPSILYALQGGRKAIVSTHTKNLQDQIFKKDIPLVHAILDKDFRVALLKGRRNYLCTTRLRNTLSSTGSLFEREELEQLNRIREWAVRTTDGDVENLGFIPNSRVWDLVCSEKEVCSSALCKTDCFFQCAKERVRSAHLIIMNHALFFNLLQMHDSDDHFIFEGDFVVFDEAQTLESVATSGLGKTISRNQTLGLIHKLYNSRTKKGLLAKEERSVRSQCREAELEAEQLFDTIRESVLRIALAAFRHPAGVVREVRIRQPYLVANTLTGPLNDLQTVMQHLEESAETDTRKQELTAARRSLWEADVLIREFLEQPEQDFTYWVELGGGRSENLTLCTSPTEIADRIGPKLFRRNTSVIMTSATLTVEGRLNYFKGRIGAGNVEECVLDSPFDHMQQMRLTLTRDIPEPDKRDYAKQLPTRILQNIDRTRGKALVLFTSNALMQSVAKEILDDFEERDLQLLVQGGDTQRHELLEEFKRDIHSVLFGLDSFWMGVDVPGEALEHVIITRLPFAVPNHPLIEARLELIEKHGGNAFMEFTLPEAVLKFRQGVGRLLRSRTDKGWVTILDSRILTKRYGRTFISSIPRCLVEIIAASGETEFLPIDEL
ncbi:MAG TPA: ATP-dependent helicase [Bacteroidetes bacterium]|jgi:ATP-dependent DNA helicase DinG|nr:ATP-dependent helicase [Bacteroidota bacterium]